MTVARRLARLEDRALAAEVARFRAWRAPRAGDATVVAGLRATLAAAGCAGETLEDLRAWEATRPPDERAACAATRALWAALAEEAPAARLRGALAALAPHLGLPPDAPPHVVLAAFNRSLAG